MVNHLSSRTFASTVHQIITDHRLPAAPWLIMHIIMTFIELSNSFTYHSITHGILTIYVRYLSLYTSQFHISCIQKKDNRPYFTVGRALDHLEHLKRTEQYVNTICFFCIRIFGLPVNEGRQRTCTKSQPQHCGRNFCKWYFPNRLHSWTTSWQSICWFTYEWKIYFNA